ncbi:MAG: hypothetical protein Q7J23_03360 [Nitrosomonas sp.]|nr:hypothetical protein [Nitrosomonas sp.]
MGAIFFYIFVYFIGYYGSNILNMLTVRPFITNRYMAALLPVYGVALTHAYVLVNSPPPQGSDVTVEYALLVFITMPVVVVTLGAAYFMWNSKSKENDHAGDNSSDDDRSSTETASIETSDQKTEVQSEDTESSDEKLVSKEVEASKSKDSKGT